MISPWWQISRTMYELEEGDEEMDEDEYGSEYDEVMGINSGFAGHAPGHELAKKKKKTKKKKKWVWKKHAKKQELEEPSLREHLLAGAYGGVAKPKPKRQGVKYTTDLTSGLVEAGYLRDLATPGQFMGRDPSRRQMGNFVQVPGNESSRERHPHHGSGHGGHGVRSSAGRSVGDHGSQARSIKLGNLGGRHDSAAKLLDPQ